jgi:hypothetical protein
MLPDSYKKLSLRKTARSFLDNRLVNGVAVSLRGDADPDAESFFAIYLRNRNFSTTDLNTSVKQRRIMRFPRHGGKA